MRRSLLFSLGVMLLGACAAPAAADPPDRAEEVEAQAGPLAPDPVTVQAVQAEHDARLAQARTQLAAARAALPEHIARAKALGVDCPACDRIGLAEPDPAWPETMPAEEPDRFEPDLHMRDLVAAVEDLPEHERAEVLTVLEADDSADDFAPPEAIPRRMQAAAQGQ